MSQCQTYTAAPSSGLEPLAVSRMVNSMLAGTPSALPVAPPKLDVMSLSTMPDWVSTSGPLEPSPGNGPAGSSGTGWEVLPDAAVVGEEAAGDDVEVEVGEVVE